MNPKHYFSTVHRALAELSADTIILLALGGIVAIGIPDYLIGLDASLYIFYILPVGIVTWYVGRNIGVFFAFLSAVPLLIEQISAHYFSHHQGLFFWNLFLHVGTMLIIALLLDVLMAHMKNEAAMARIDAVTGIWNRRGFFEHLQFSLDLMSREKMMFALAYIDLDNFKTINDSYGHNEGDRILRLAATTLKKSVRHSDVAARLGGDEFALLIRGVNREQASIFIEKIRDSLRRVFEADQSKLTCSIGCVTFQTLIPDLDSAISMADALMYKVKRSGKNNAMVEEYNSR